MTIFEKARDLGEALLETEQGKRVNEARYIFDGNEEAQKLLNDFTQYRSNIQMQIQRGELSEDEIAKESAKINGMMEDLHTHPVIGELIKAENNFGIIVNEVINVLRATITGEEEGQCGCGGGCSSCGGCH